ncbi:sodium:solute symporter family transporter [Aeoliella mucimassa]
MAGEPQTESPNGFLHWQSLPKLPNPVGVAGPFVGVDHDALVVAGGANFPKQPYWENDKVWHADAWVLTRDSEESYQWHSGFALDAPMAYGAVANTSKGIACLGGDDGKQVSKKCFLLRWMPESQKLERTPLPDLPAPCAYGAATSFGDVVYLACGQADRSLLSATTNLWRLDLNDPKPAWESLAPLPGPERAFNDTIAQHNGFNTCVYVFGGRCVKSESTSADDIVPLSDLYEFNPTTNTWRRRADLPHPLMAGTAIPAGQSHIIALSGADGSLWEQAAELKLDHPGFKKQSLAYHTITNTWVEAGETPANAVTTPATQWGDRYVLASGERQPGVRTDEVWLIELKQQDHSFGAIDFSVLGVYLIAMVGVGVFFARQNKSTDDYFRGGQKVLWWAAGCSIFATMLSSITFMAIPAKAYAQDLVYLLGNCMILAVAPIAVYLALPFFRQIDATSAYEYLEKRFNRLVRLFASASFTLFHLFRMGIVMSLAALTLATVTPLSPVESVLLMGVLSILYCTLGGVEAVIWTDTIQTVVLLGGAVVCLSVMLWGTGDSAESWSQLAWQEGKLQFANLHLDPTSASLALWVVVIGGIGQNISSYTADQAVVQRYMTTPDQSRAARSIWFAAILAIPASFLFFFMGTALFLFYHSHPEKLDPTFTTDQILPLFIANELPVGIAGLLVAGIFAAAQSTVSTSMNSTATAVVTDFLRPFAVLRSEHGYLQAARGFTLLFGVIGTVIALLFVSPDIRSLFDQFVKVIGLFMGVLGGLFALGMLTRRATGIGALVGAIAGAVIMLGMPYYSDINGFLYATIGVTFCFAIGYLVSLLVPAQQANIAGLTLFSLKKSSSRGPSQSVVG